MFCGRVLVMAAQLYTFTKNREFSSNPVVRTLNFHCRGPGFNQSLDRELQSHELHGMAKKQKTTEKKEERN